VLINVNFTCFQML